MAISASDYAYFANLSYSNDIEKDLSSDMSEKGWDIISTNRGFNGFQAVALGRITNSSP